MIIPLTTEAYALLGVCLALAGLVWVLFCRRRAHNLRGKRVIITGGAQGLGKEIAQVLLKKGCVVALVDIDVRALVHAERDLKGHGDVKGYRADVSDSSGVIEVVQRITKTQFEGLSPDILINNAGLVSGKSFVLDELDDDVIERTLGVNLRGPINLIRCVLPQMRSGRTGHIVNISSVMSQLYAPRLSDYCMSKAALSSFHRCMRMELRRSGINKNIHTTLVMPYVLDTRMFKSILQPWYIRLLFPPLKATDVAERVVTAIEKRQLVLILPTVLAFMLPVFGLFPEWLQDVFVEMVGAGEGMENFSKKGQPNPKRQGYTHTS